MGADVAYIIVFTDWWNSNTVKYAQYIRILRDEAAQQSMNQRNLGSAVSIAAEIHWATDVLRPVLGKSSLSSRARLDVFANFNHPQATKFFSKTLTVAHLVTNSPNLYGNPQNDSQSKLSVRIAIGQINPATR
jgi:hypothetical protein